MSNISTTKKQVDYSSSSMSIPLRFPVVTGGKISFQAQDVLSLSKFTFIHS